MFNTLFGQSVLKTQDASGSSELIIPFKDNYFIYNYGKTYLQEYNSKHQFVKSIYLKKEYRELNIVSNDDNLAILEGLEDQCDIFPKNAFSIDKNGKVKIISAKYNYLWNDYAQNVYFGGSNSPNIEIRRWSDSTIVAKKDLYSVLNKVLILIPLEKDTFLVGDEKDNFFKLTASSDYLIKIPKFLVKTPINERSIINVSPSYFFVTGQGLYSRKSLKLVLPSTEYSINMKEINGKIYIFKNTVQEYELDSKGNFVKTNTVLSDYTKKGMILNDFKPYKNQWLICGSSPFYNTGKPNNSTYYQDFHGVTDSLTQEVTNFHDIAFNIPTQKNPVWDKKCGYKFENIELLIENKGKDTLKTLQLRSEIYGYGFFCFGASQDFWRLSDLVIPPNSKFTYQLANFCTRGIKYDNSTKDSTRTICITSSSPNQNLDILFKDNYSCYTFPKDPKEIFLKSNDVSELNINIYNDENTLYLEGNTSLQNIKLLLYSIDGRLMLSEKINNLLPQQIDISNLPKALYIVQVITDNQRFITRKIVK